MKKTLLYLQIIITTAAFHDANAQSTDRIIVHFSAKTEKRLSQIKAPEFMKALNQKLDSQLRYARPSSYGHILQLPQAQTNNEVQALAKALMAYEEISYAEADRKKYPSFIPNDQFYQLQWNLHDESGGINIKKSWTKLAHDTPITIAVIDTGITYHSDLHHRVVGGYDFISDLKTANDGNGRDHNPSDPGDAVMEGECGENDPDENTSSSWHGTMVTGLLIAETHNQTGIAGIVGLNPQASVLPVRVLGKCGGYTSDIIDAARWASGLSVPGVPDNPHPARILNLSLGGEGKCSPSEQQAIDEILNNNSIVVVSAGNENEDAFNYSPSGCNGVITVAASSRDGGRTDYSNFGPSIDISAPGGTFVKSDLENHLFSTFNSGKTHPIPGDAYAYISGSSFAAPSVTGTIALLLDINPSLTLTQIYNILRTNSQPFSNSTMLPCTNLHCGAGILDVDKAVDATLQNKFLDEPMPNKTPYNGQIDTSSTTTQTTDAINSHGSTGGGIIITMLIPLLILLLAQRKPLN